MALQIRRGTDARRTSMPLALAQGELAYTTDTKRLFVGDGTTIGGNPVSPVISVNGQTGTITLTTDNISEGTSNLYHTVNRVKDVVGSLLSTGTNTGLTVSYNSSTHAISLTNTNVINSGIANGIAYYAANGTVLSSSQSIQWDEFNNILTNTNGTYKLISNLVSSTSILQQTYNDTTTGGNIWKMQRARGTNITPTTVGAGDSIHQFAWYGYDGTAFIQNSIINGIVPLQTTSGVPVSTGIVPGQLEFSTRDKLGNIQVRLRIGPNGQIQIGPNSATETGSTGSLLITQTVSSANASALVVRNYFTDAAGPRISTLKARGTVTAPTTVVNGDQLQQQISFAYDGTAVRTAVTITTSVDGVVSTGIVPSAVTFATTNNSGTLTPVLKIDHAGTLSTTVTPGTFWNYDSSSSTLTLTLGQVVTFANFSGSVLVNCYNSGTVSQYLCGGGGLPFCIGSSRVTQTGSMQAISGGYTFTASEAGIHSFYVIRTRTGA